jgi:hypothetical protein
MFPLTLSSCILSPFIIGSDSEAAGLSLPRNELTCLEKLSSERLRGLDPELSMRNRGGDDRTSPIRQVSSEITSHHEA